MRQRYTKGHTVKKGCLILGSHNLNEQIKLIKTHTRAGILFREYEGYGYRILVTEMEDDKEIICKPLNDILYQPEIIARKDMSFVEPVKIMLNRKAIRQEISYLEIAEQLMDYIDENFDII